MARNDMEDGEVNPRVWGLPCLTGFGCNHVLSPDYGPTCTAQRHQKNEQKCTEETSVATQNRLTSFRPHISGVDPEMRVVVEAEEKAIPTAGLSRIFPTQPEGKPHPQKSRSTAMTTKISQAIRQVARTGPCGHGSRLSITSFLTMGFDCTTHRMVN